MFSDYNCFLVPKMSSVNLTSQASTDQQFLKTRPLQKYKNCNLAGTFKNVGHLLNSVEK